MTTTDVPDEDPGQVSLGCREAAQASALFGCPLAQGKKTHFPSLVLFPFPLASLSGTKIITRQQQAGIQGSAETCQSITLTILRQSALIPSRCGLSDSSLTKPRVGVDENQQKSISVLDHQGEGQAQAGLEV